MDQTLFYVLGILLVVAAIATFAIGTLNDRFPAGPLFPLVLAGFVLLVGGTTTFAVLNAKSEQKKRRADLAAEEKRLGATPVPGGGEVPSPDAAVLGGAPSSAPPSGGKAAPPQPKVKGPGGTLAVAASPTQLAFDKKSLSSKPGKVTIDFTNPAAIQHDVAIEKGSQILGKTPLVAKGKQSVSVELAPGSYTFLCTVPGHAQAGMMGTLTIK